MLRDITIGQFYPRDSVIHRLDPRVKIVGVLLYMISLFLFHSYVGYVLVTLFLGTVIGLSSVPLSYILKGLKPILILLLFTAFFHVFMTEGDVIFHWKFITVTWQGLSTGLFMSMRLIYLILGSSMLTYTTTPTQLTDALESLLKPLGKMKVPVHEFAMMMSLALRFIPILLEETNRLMDAQSARGADFEEGRLWTRLRAMVSILVPLLVSAMRRAAELAQAMETRCYHGGKRTKMKPLHYRIGDVAAYGIIFIYLGAVILVPRWIVWGG